MLGLFGMVILHQKEGENEMKISAIEPTIVSVPYTHRETSSRIQRDGVTAVVVKVTTDDGLVGWGESCPGSNAESVYEVIKSVGPIFKGRDPWQREALAADIWGSAHWYNREMTGNFAFAGIDMALWDICGQACQQPVYNLLGGLCRKEVDYFYYLAYGTAKEVAAQAQDGLAKGYTVFYVKVGIDIRSELAMMGALRDAIGPEKKIRIDANGSWTLNEAVRYLALFDEHHIDFAEQPVWPDPIRNMVELKQRTPVALSANEGLWRVADVLCLSSNWVGTLGQFYRLSCQAHLEGITVCKHTHGELGLMAAASQHVCLTIPNGIDGNQQTAQMMDGDVIKEALPIAGSPTWGVPEGTGLCVTVDEDLVAQYHAVYRERGQFLPYQVETFPSL
jgi:glucarate dehydratase